MSSTRRLLLATAAVSLFAHQAQAWGWGSGERIKGNGEVVTELRDTGSFDAITLSDRYDVIVKPGSAIKVEVKADKNVLPYLVTQVQSGSKGRSLEIGAKSGFSLNTTGNPVITIEMPMLRAVSLAGSGNISVEGMKGSNLDAALAGSGDLNLRGVDFDKLGLRVSGSGNIIATGRSANAGLTIAGSGDIKSTGLVADEVKVSIAGSGSAAVQASKKLHVSIAGSGDVRYSGSPEVTSSIAGSGTVGRLKE